MQSYIIHASRKAPCDMPVSLINASFTHWFEALYRCSLVFTMTGYQAQLTFTATSTGAIFAWAKMLPLCNTQSNLSPLALFSFRLLSLCPLTRRGEKMSKWQKAKHRLRWHRSLSALSNKKINHRLLLWRTMLFQIWNNIAVVFCVQKPTGSHHAAVTHLCAVI